MQLFKKGILKSKPKKVNFCPTCKAHLSMEHSMEKFRGRTWHNYDSKYSNCIVPCGYGMFAPRYYKETIIDVRREYKPKHEPDKVG